MKLLEEEARAYLQHTGPRLNQSQVVRSEEEALQAADSHGLPVTLKIANKTVVHKSDVDGIRVGVSTREGVLRAFQELLPVAEASGESGDQAAVMVQEHVVGNLEMYVAARRDRSFGPVVILGLGGIWIEVLDDVALRVWPISPVDVERMCQGLRAWPILSGARGKAPLPLDGIIAQVLACGELLTNDPRVALIELNPVLVDRDSGEAVAVDVLLEIEQEG
jgi:succinyl-CoA synthetase beta subunit